MRTAGLLPLSFALAAGVLASCATTHLARPVGRGNTRVSLTAGGPIADIGGKPIPAPLAVVGVAHGVSNSLDVHADVHPFVALFNPGNGSIPVLGLDMGFAWHPIHTSLAALTLGGALYGFTNRLDAVVFTDLWIAADIQPTTWFSFATGVHNVFRLGTSDPYLDRAPVWTPTAFLQLAFRPFSGRVTIDLEGRWYAFSRNGTVVAPTFYTIADIGALGVLLGVHFQFGGATR